MNINLNVQLLKGALECAGKKDVRYYLNGVFIDVLNEEELVYCGTDGHILFAAKAPLDSTSGDPVGTSLTIPRTVIEAALKGVKSQTVELAAVHEGSYRLNQTIFLPVDGKFPDYQRVIPQEVSGEKATFDPDLLVRGSKAISLSVGGRGELQHNGEKAAVMTSASESVIVVVMPMRDQSYEVYKGWTKPKAYVDQSLAA